MIANENKENNLKIIVPAKTNSWVLGTFISFSYTSVMTTCKRDTHVRSDKTCVIRETFSFSSL